MICAGTKDFKTDACQGDSGGESNWQTYHKRLEKCPMITKKVSLLEWYLFISWIIFKTQPIKQLLSSVENIKKIELRKFKSIINNFIK